ncbi:unnamed protein product [Cladocopium goreaui]|uniref:Uncharacterized protein n=1 Tax=Cladocopium goreaui TaxID=2562237 RepID=A0A9P1FLR2_9DINO|nr:unnamed protein product [Cladocopium goreaui]
MSPTDVLDDCHHNEWNKRLQERQVPTTTTTRAISTMSTAGRAGGAGVKRSDAFRSSLLHFEIEAFVRIGGTAMAHIQCLMGGVTDRTGILPKPSADMAMARWPEACVRTRHQKRTGRKVRCSGLLKGLHRLLRRLDQKLRHRVLSQRFTEAQRQTFERWMLSRPDSHPRDRDRRVKVTQVTKIRARKAQKVSLAAAFRRKAGLAHLHGLVVHPRLKSAAVRYSAEVTIDRLRLLTKEHHCLEVVQGFRSALVDMKKRMEGVGQAAFEARFREVLAACLAEHQLQPRAMGLRFCVLLGSLWLPRPLATPPFLAEGQALDAGLCAWRRLGEARGRVLRRGSVLQVQSPDEIAATWSRVRCAYLDAVAASSAGNKRKAIEAAARLQVLEAAQAGQRERQLERWNRRRMAQEEATQRRNPRAGANEILKRVDQLLQMWSRHSIPEM